MISSSEGGLYEAHLLRSHGSCTEQCHNLCHFLKSPRSPDHNLRTGVKTLRAGILSSSAIYPVAHTAPPTSGYSINI